jgi:hypothetical protein
MRATVSEGHVLVGVFPAGSMVTVEIVKLPENALVVEAGECHESLIPGVFFYQPSLSPTAYTQYAYRMTDSYDESIGTFDLGGYPDALLAGVADNHADIGTLISNLAEASSAIAGDVADLDADLVSAVDLIRGDKDDLDADLQAAVEQLREDIAKVKSSTDHMEFVVEMLAGNREIVGNQMIFRDQEGVEIARFNLFDSKGRPSMINVFKRERV